MSSVKPYKLARLSRDGDVYNVNEVLSWLANGCVHPHRDCHVVHNALVRYAPFYGMRRTDLIARYNNAIDSFWASLQGLVNKALKDHYNMSVHDRLQQFRGCGDDFYSERIDVCIYFVDVLLPWLARERHVPYYALGNYAAFMFHNMLPYILLQIELHDAGIASGFDALHTKGTVRSFARHKAYIYWNRAGGNADVVSWLMAHGYIKRTTTLATVNAYLETFARLGVCTAACPTSLLRGFTARASMSSGYTFDDNSSTRIRSVYDDDASIRF